MIIDDKLLTDNERVSFKLRKIYDDAGFERYTMTKFEEYKLYAGHMDFLVSDNVITFTDTNGKLMALKPDITLSIVKNFASKPSELRKVYYNENVYRISKGTGSFKEITQAGVEIIGDKENVSSKEILMLAEKSLCEIDGDTVLNVSHLGILMKAIDSVLEFGKSKDELVNIVKSKAVYELDDKYKYLIEIMTMFGTFNQVKDKLMSICKEIEAMNEFFDFAESVEGLEDNAIVDFSLVLDTNYYNGIVFAGFKSGVPDSVLSGGRYDKLLQKMGLKSKAIGFAIYLDKLRA